MRIAVLATAVCLSIVGLSAASDVQAAIRRPTSIPAQGLAPALQILARDRDFQVVYRSEVVGKLRTQGASGELTADEALRQLLSGTGLTFRYLDDKTVTITATASSAPTPTDAQETPSAPQAFNNPDTPDSGTAKKAGFWDRFRLAQNDPSSSSQNDSPSSRQESPSQSSDKNSESSVLDEIFVTGSRLRSRGDGPAPVTVFDRDRIDQLGASSVAAVLSYLPQQSFTTTEQFNFGGSQIAQLRGLTVGTTLVLINGRRTVTSAVNGAQNFFDLNSIPIAAVERVEILSDSASAIYGADAVGGVVNIVLKEEVAAPEMFASYGAADGGADERRYSLAFGHVGDRFRASVTFDHFEREFLLGGQRDLFANQDFTRFGGPDRRSASANPGNVCRQTNANLPGLTTRCAAVPAGSTGVGLTPADFVATAGQTNLESLNQYRSLVPEAERDAGAGFFDFDLSSNLTLFGELMYAERSATSYSSLPTLANRLVPATNPFNPFGVPVTVSFALTGIGPAATVSDSEFLRVVAGLKGEVGVWDWEAAYLETDESGQSVRPNIVNTAAVNAALASTNPATALNPFQDGPGGSPALLATLVTSNTNRYDSTGKQIGAFARGPLFSLPAGEVEFVIGAEGREEQVHFEALPSIVLDADRDTWSAYSELRVPIVGEGVVPGIEELTLSVAARTDDYSDFGSTFNPQYGLQWRPVRTLLVRASYGTAFRAPSLFELYSPLSTFPTPVFDARRNETVTVSSLCCGNSNLQPENSESWTTGFVYQSDAAHKLRLSTTYWHIDYEDRIEQLLDVVILANEQLFPGRVVRAAPTPADVAAGLPGQVISINSSNVNAGALSTSGLDFEVSATIQSLIGELTPSLTATWVGEYTTADVPEGPTADRVGVGSLSGTIPEWRATAVLGWSAGAFGGTIAARYVDGYDDFNSSLNARNGRRIDAETYLDLQGSLSFGDLFERAEWLSGLTLRVGLINALDEEAQYSEVNPTLGHDTSIADMRQRFTYISLAMQF